MTREMLERCLDLCGMVGPNKEIRIPYDLIWVGTEGTPEFSDDWVLRIEVQGKRCVKPVGLSG
jgi:hypothetical protein